MTQTQPNNAPVPTTRPPAPSVSRPNQVNPGADSDPLMHLHKMSTTAGLGSGDYVAINLTAVIAVLFGIASILAALGAILLIIPLIGVFLAVLALIQIRNSNGTQTGRGLALAGLVLSGSISTFLLASTAVDAVHRRADYAQIGGLFQQFGNFVTTDQFDKAYEIFDTAFHNRVARNAFKVHLTNLQHNPNAFPMGQIDWNGLADFKTDAAGDETAVAFIRVHYQGTYNEEHMEARLKKEASTWRIDNIADLFPAPRNQNAAPQD